MIFVTVGEQLPFDRLIRAVDEWAKQSDCEVFAQIGRTKYKPQHFMYKDFLTQEEYKANFIKADLIVAHAGMGTIISALELSKPLLVMPRLTVYGEVRSDHQVATAQRFATLNYVTVASDEIELIEKLNILGTLILNEANKQNIEPSPLLIKTIRKFLQSQ